MKTVNDKQYVLYNLRKDHIVDMHNKECYDYYGARLYANGGAMYINDKLIPYNQYYNAEYNIAKRKHCNWRKYKKRYLQ